LDNKKLPINYKLAYLQAKGWSITARYFCRQFPKKSFRFFGPQKHKVFDGFGIENAQKALLFGVPKTRTVFEHFDLKVGVLNP